MRKWTFVALLLVGATVLGATVLREPIASAAQNVGATITGPLDADGNVAVHEQGTARVQLEPTNITGVCGTFNDCDLQQEVVASLIVLEIGAGVQEVMLEDGAGATTLHLFGPAFGGQSHYVLPLTQPIRVKHLHVFTEIGCTSCVADVHVAGTAVP